MVQTERKGHEPRSGREIIKDPYEQVARVFEGFTMRPPRDFTSHDALRGGVPTGRCVRRVQNGDGNPHPSAKLVESSFTEPQNEYVRITFEALTKMAKGKVYGEPDETVKPFHERVLEHLQTGDFHEAIYTSTVGLYEDFCDRYPNLMPAFDAIHTAGGLIGIATLIPQTTLDVFNSPECPIKRSKKDLIEMFTQEHGPEDSLSAIDPQPYQVWCAGEAFAKTLIRESHEAAIQAQKEGLNPRYPASSMDWAAILSSRVAYIINAKEKSLSYTPILNSTTSPS